MTFMEEIIAHSMPLWEEAAEEEFLKSNDHHYLRKETRHAASRFGRR